MKIAAQRYWSRLPGKRTDPKTGSELPTRGPLVSIFEWYHTILDVLNSIQQEFGDIKVISLDPRSAAGHIVEHLKTYKPRSDNFRLPDDLYFGTLTIGGVKARLYSLEDLHCENVYLTTVEDKHVELVMLDC